jgi:NADP-dependent 3-hydroxy acid dehydrogenase YdfG
MRNPERGDGIRSIAEKENLSIKIIKLDVEEDKSVKGAITTIFLESGRLDILINNAGCVYLGALEDLSIEEIKS